MSILSKLGKSEIKEFMKDIIEVVCHNSMFELNDDLTRSKTSHQINMYLKLLESNPNLEYAFSQCDDRNNPPDFIDDNKFSVYLHFKFENEEPKYIDTMVETTGIKFLAS